MRQKNSAIEVVLNYGIKIKFTKTRLSTLCRVLCATVPKTAVVYKYFVFLFRMRESIDNITKNIILDFPLNRVDLMC